MLTRVSLLAAAAATLLGVAGRAGASDRLRHEIREKLAAEIQKLLTQEGQEAVAVGEFIGPARLDANSGPGIRQLLTEELGALGVRVDPRANLTVQGRYAKLADKDHPGLILVRLTAEVFDRNDERRGEFYAQIRDSGDIAQLLGVTVSLPTPEAGAKGRHQELDRRIEEPRVHLDGPRVSARPGSPFGVEVRVKAAAGAVSRPRDARREAGGAFVDVRRDELYEIALANDSDGEVAVAVTIDGLDVFAFSEVRDPKTGRPRYGYYLLGPRRQTTVAGWHLRDAPPDNYASFRVTRYGDGASARARAPAPGKRGVITVTFLPAYEGRPRTAADETGFGPPTSVRVRPTQRSIGPALESVSIRYTH